MFNIKLNCLIIEYIKYVALLILIKRPRDVAQFGSAPRLGRGGRTFESCHPDHLNQKGFRILSETLFGLIKKLIINDIQIHHIV